MDTTQPSQNSQPGPSPQIVAQFDRLKGYGVRPENLVILIMGQNEMVLGEGKRMGYSALFGSAHGVVSVKNPKRFIRMSGMRPGGKIEVQIIISDFDYINEGTIELKPIGGFFIEWLDEVGQVQYLSAYADWLDGRREASARAAGIVVGPADVAKAAELSKIIRGP